MRTMMRRPLSGIATAGLVAGMTVSVASGQSAIAVPDKVKAVFQKNCTVCHKGKYPPRNLNLESASLPAAIADIPSSDQPGLKLIDSGFPGSSYLLMKIRGAEGISGKRMPPPGKPALTTEELAVLENWILGLQEPDVSTEAGDRARGPKEDFVPAPTGAQAEFPEGGRLAGEAPRFSKERKRG